MAGLTLFPEPGPRVFNAPPGLPFPDAFARGVLSRLAASGAGPEALADVEIIVSTQRAVRALRSAFVAASSGGALGPKLRTLSDLARDVDAPADAVPAMDGARRLLMLTQLVRALLEREPALGAPVVAPRLAADLIALLDSAQAAGASLDGLDTIGEGDHAAHWALSRRFLEIIRAAWPAMLAAEERLDPEDRRRRVVAAYAERWSSDPPALPVIVAGSTGSLDTSAWFISLVAALPQGAVVLPGLDGDMDARAAEQLFDGLAPEHPQAGLFQLCRRIGVAPEDVTPWTPDSRPHAGPRKRWLSQALRPAPATDAWRDAAAPLHAEAGEAMRGVALIEAAGPREEAAAIAIALREALETPGLHAALITPDRTLARRVAAELSRWGVEPDDSGGRPLSLTAPGVFMSLVAEVALAPSDPAKLLAMLKHPLCAAGFERGAHLRATRVLEQKVLRADRMAADRDVAHALAALSRDDEAHEVDDAADDAADDSADQATALELGAWWATIESLIAPLRAAFRDEAPLQELIARHAEAATALSRWAGRDAAELFQRAAGETLASFIDHAGRASHGFPAIPGADYLALLSQLMAGEAVREAFGRHPRIAFLGPLEARLQTADLVILGGLNEGVWPTIPEPDPWISRDMRAILGLPPLESRIGLSAHDFFQAAMASRVVLSRSRRSDGSPTTPSRWLLRLTTLMRGVAPEALAEISARGDGYLALSRRLDAPEEALAPEQRSRLTPAGRPAPAPPLDARPRRLSATEVETLIRDPYAVYARRVLRLKPLPELAEGPDARDRGELLHQLVERFVRETMAPPWTDAAWDMDAARGLYDDIAARTLAPLASAWPTQHVVWSARAAAIREWFLETEAARRASGRPVALETPGTMTLETLLGPVTLSATADRIDRRYDRRYAIYDYKTGLPPTEKQIGHFAKQLPLEAAILAARGFEGAPVGPVSLIGYLRLQGGRIGGDERSYENAEALADEAIVGLARLLARYADPAQPYRPRARPQFLAYDGAYDHLARFGEWADGA